MKSTIILDKDNLIIGFGTPSMDPIETQKVVKTLVLKDTGFLEIKVLYDNLKEESEKSIEKMREVQNSLRLNKKTDAENSHKDFLEHQAEIEKIMKTLKPLLSNLDSTKKQLIREHAVYMTPKKGEEIIKDEATVTELKNKFKALVNGKRLKKNGSEVVDYRGYKGYEKKGGAWELVEIKAIGDGIGASKKFDKFTNNEQTEIMVDIEKKRVSKLNAAEKLAEKTAAIAHALSAAAIMRSELEIQGVSEEDALAQSTAWYDAEVLNINAKYA